MSATVTLSCDGHRNGERCRGFLPTRRVDVDSAIADAVAHGWRCGDLHLCPSGEHTEDAR